MTETNAPLIRNIGGTDSDVWALEYNELMLLNIMHQPSDQKISFNSFY